MTHTLSIISVVLVAIFLSQTTFAQYATNTTLNTDKAPTHVNDGQRVANAGKTLMFTGASIAMTGFVIGSASWIANYGSKFANLSAIYTLIGGVSGAVVALVGLPIYSAGRHKMNYRDVSLMTVSNEGQQGSMITVEVEVEAGIPNHLSINVTGGYNCNKHLFVGGGIGCGSCLPSNNSSHDNANLIVPAFANVRLTFGSKHVAPYMSTRLGYDFNQFKLYSAIEFGTNIRRTSNVNNGAWCLGKRTECLGN